MKTNFQRKLRCVLVLSGLLFGGSAVLAEPSTSELDSKIQSLQEQVDALKSKTPAAEGSASAGGLEYKGVHITLGGFLASETMDRNNILESDVGTNYTKIPFANSAAYGQSEFRGSERQSRFSLLAQGNPNADTVLSGYYELDFLGTSPTANQNESNSFTPRTRNIYGTFDWQDIGFHILAGQNWSLLTMNKEGIIPRTEAVPTTIDAQYEVGFQWARQWQLRLVKDWQKKYWAAVSFESPQTVGLAGSAASGTGNTYQFQGGNLFAPTNMSINAYPDVIIKLAADTDFGHYEVYNLNRDFESHFGGTTVASQTNKQSAWTSSVGGGGIIPIYPKVIDLTLSGLVGKGIGRYGTAGLSDVTYRADGGLAPLNGAQELAQLAWHASETWDVYLAYGQEQVGSSGNGSTYGYGNGLVASNAGCSMLGGTCAPLLKNIAQGNAGFWWSFYKGNTGTAKLGLQYSHTTLATYADNSGVAPHTAEDEVYTSLRYYPF